MVGNAGKDFLADPMILGEVHRERPEPQNIRAIIAHQIERVDGIAERLGHFHALLVHRKAMRQHRLIRRATTRAAAFEQARLEPAAMLVAAFKIKIGGAVAHQIGPFAAFEHKRMRAARIEPDIKNISDALIIGERVSLAKIGLRRFVVPRIDAALAHPRDDPRIDRRVAQILARFAIDKQGDRHAPRALAAKHPIGAPLDHRGDPILPLFGDPARRFDRGQRGFPQSPPPACGGG